MVQNHSPFYNKPMQSLNPKDLQFGTVSLHYFFSLILIPHSNYHLLFPNKKVYICILFFPIRKVNTFIYFFAYLENLFISEQENYIIIVIGRLYK